MSNQKDILIIGGGMSGLTSAIEAAEAGYKVIIVEKNPYLGGRAAQLNKYFPKLCPPTCGLEMQFKRIKNNGNITIYTLSEIEKITGEEGNYEATIRLNPRYVNDRCVGCNDCAKACPVERPNDFNLGMDKTKAAYLPFEQAFPFRYVIDDKFCADDCKKACLDTCRYNAIDLNMKAVTVNVKVGAVVMATGWKPYDAAKIENLGFGRAQNVITNMMMERLASPNGPTKGKIIRPSDGREAKNVAFVQCAGSRDENHLSYCSYVCCLASLKQATYVRGQYPDSKAQIFYIDIRTPGRYEQFYWKVRDDKGVTLTKGKVAKITEDPVTKDVIIEAEDVAEGIKIKAGFDMVVLAAGMAPNTRDLASGMSLPLTDEGFVNAPSLQRGFCAAGTLKSPVDVARSVQDATGAAIKSIQSLQTLFLTQSRKG